MKYNDKKIQVEMLGAVKKNYDFNINSVKFFPIGEESYSYILTTNQGKVFLKYCESQEVLKSIDKINQLLLQLKDLSFITPPIAVHDQTTFEVLKGKIYAFPYVAGEIVRKGNHEFEKRLVDELTQIVAQIHNKTPYINIDLEKENFMNDYKERLQYLLDVDYLDQDVKQLLEMNKSTVENLIQRHTEIGNKYKNLQTDFVLTHGDVTGLNIMITADGIKLFDWDGALFAPAERDLMFLYHNPHFEIDKYASLTERVYNPELTKYYHQQWDLDSIVGNFESLAKSGLNNANKQDLIDEINQYLNYHK